MSVDACLTAPYDGVEEVGEVRVIGEVQGVQRRQGEVRVMGKEGVQRKQTAATFIYVLIEIHT